MRGVWFPRGPQPGADSTETMGTMTSGASGPHDDDGFHVVVADDGSVSATELARLGSGPGARLRLVPEQRPARHGRMAGALAAKGVPDAVDELLRGLDAAKAGRIATYRVDADLP